MSEYKMIPNLKYAKIDTGKPKIVITGCGRSGTLFMARVFRKLGFVIGHEGLQKDGISSWYIAEKSRSIILKKHLKEFKTFYFHIVRHPIDVINSMWRLEELPHRAALDFFRRSHPEYNHLSGSPLHVAMWWIVWNKEVQQNFPNANLFKIEEVARKQIVCDICKIVGVEFKDEIYQAVKNLGRKVHTLCVSDQNYLENKGVLKITFDIIQELDSKIANELRHNAEYYGYEI